jgi:protoporphyrinogen oxidase
MDLSADLVVLGAGPAGLTAAWRAAQRGMSVIVLERTGAVGGMAGSFEVAGIRVDQGSHRLHPTTPINVLGQLRRLLGSDLQRRRRNGRLRVAGRWVYFPLRASGLATALPGGMLAGIGRDALTYPLRRPSADTYAEVLRAGLGRTMYDAVYGPYAVKLWGLPGERIDGDQARRRVTANSPWKVAARAARGGRDEAPGQFFYYPRRGFGQIAEALADATVAEGGEILLNAEVDRVEVGVDSATASTQDGDVVKARHAFSTIPLPVLARMTRPAPSLTDIESAGRLRFRAMLLVYLVHEGGRWTQYDAHYIPGPETPVTRVSEPANYRDSPDDRQDRSVLCAEVPCSMTEELWGASDEELGYIVQEGLARVGLPPVRRAHVEVRRLGQVYPIYQVGYREQLAGLDNWAMSLPTVTTFGRHGLFTHDNTHHALVMAYDAVDALGNDGQFNSLAWAAARARFAAHVVED